MLPGWQSIQYRVKVTRILQNRRKYLPTSDTFKTYTRWLHLDYKHFYITIIRILLCLVVELINIRLIISYWKREMEIWLICNLLVYHFRWQHRTKVKETNVSKIVYKHTGSPIRFWKLPIVLPHVRAISYLLQFSKEIKRQERTTTCLEQQHRGTK